MFGTFHPKEISIMNLNEPDSAMITEHCCVDTSLQLDDKARKSVWYVEKFVHGLPFANDEHDKPRSECMSTLKLAIEDAIRENALIGYKGGNHERDALISLGGGNNMINIETLGCPKFKEINAITSTCRKHSNLSAHMCSRAKLIAYGSWLRSRFATDAVTTT